MIQNKEKLIQLYTNIFYVETAVSANKKKISVTKLKERYMSLFESEDKVLLEENDIFRKQLFNLCSVYQSQLTKKLSKNDNSTLDDIKALLDYQIKTLCEYDILNFEKKYPNILIDEIINNTKKHNQLVQYSIINYFEIFYMEEFMKNDISKLMCDNPEDEYPDARNMKRHFVLHIGPTNSGKTYESIERLKQCEKGAYFGPLRLLALEIYDKLNAANVACDMITGEEELKVPDSVCISCTIEMLNIEDYFDIVVVDEAQMLQDPFRGYNWTKAILGLKANEIHLCLAPEAKDIVVKLIERCKDTYEIHEHERKTPLTFDFSTISLNEVQQGDALIVFSKKSVLAVSAELKKLGINASVIYGNLPPATRRRQVQMFTNEETKVVVSTDAIGMGLNLPIKRIIFLETEKFDGNDIRPLQPEEIKQIAGRAGRMGLYDEGKVLSIKNKSLIKNALDDKLPQIKKAYLGFPETIVSLPFDLDDIMKTWADIQSPSLYKKMNVEVLLLMYNSLKENTNISEFNKTEIYKMITCPLDVKNENIMELWHKYCNALHYVSDMYLPRIDKYIEDLNILETHYKELDLYFQFSRKFKKDIDLTTLTQEKEYTVECINDVLDKNKLSFIKKCKRCGKQLDYTYKFTICQKCYNRRFKY